MNTRTIMMITLLLLLLGGGLAIWNAGRNTERPKAVNVKQSLKNDEMIAHNVSFVVTEGQVKKWKIVAETAHYNQSRTDADLTVVKGEFYDKEGKPVMQFSAPKGIYRSMEKAVTLTGGVTARTLKKGNASAPSAPLIPMNTTSTKPAADESVGILDGGEIRSPKMVWDAKSSWVNATGGVKLTFAKGTTTATACRFNLDFSQLFLKGDVASALIQ
jgi:LPS export ABC transporter protein LptC